MFRIVRYVLTHILLPLYTFVFIRTKTRKPKSDIHTYTQTIAKINHKIQIDSIVVKKIDTETNILKNEILIGITLVGEVSDSVNALAGYYFNSAHFIETVDNEQKHITIEIIPKLKSVPLSVLKSKLSHTKVKYNYLSSSFTFEFYLEKCIVFSGFGEYKIDIKCAQKMETINVFRYK